MDDFVVVQIVEATSDPNQLRKGERRIRLQICQTHQLQAIDSWVLCYVRQHISMWHPLRNHAKLEQFWRHAFNRQDIWMFRSLGNYDLFAVFLDKESPVNPQ